MVLQDSILFFLKQTFMSWFQLKPPCPIGVDIMGSFNKLGQGQASIPPTTFSRVIPAPFLLAPLPAIFLPSAVIQIELRIFSTRDSFVSLKNVHHFTLI